jgi:hypothetical protein
MDHDDMRRRNVADLYLAGELPPDECASFEEHFFDCRLCQEDLEIARSFRQGMRSAARVVSPGRFSSRAFFLLAAAAALLIAVPAFLSYRSLQATMRRAVDALDAEQAAHKRDLALLSAPQPGVHIVRLESFRSASATPVTVAAGHSWTVLSIPQPPDRNISAYRATLDRPSGESAWHREISPEPGGGINIALPPGWLTPAHYRLRLERIDQEGRSTPAGEFLLHVVQP